MTSSLSPFDFSGAPGFYGQLNGEYVPTKSIEITQSSYGVADEITITTPLSMATVDYGALSQKVPGAPVQIFGGFGSTQGTGPKQPVVQGVLESLSNDYDNDTITIKARGILANLVDARLSTKIVQNQTITQAITKIIQKYGLTARVSPSTIQVGAVLSGASAGAPVDQVSTARNMRALDFIHMLCRTAGWTTRAVGGVVVVGPPPDTKTAPLITLNWAAGGLMSLHIEHNALHNRNIKVKVVSYIQSGKQRGLSVNSTPLASSIGIPNQQSTTSKAQPGSPSGRQSGFTSVGERTNVEEYVIPIPNLTQQQCIDRAAAIAFEINQHEFTADMSFSIGSEFFAQVVLVSPDFNVQLNGCDQASNNGLYYPKDVKWTWSAEKPDGLMMEIQAINHPLPAPGGGQPT